MIFTAPPPQLAWVEASMRQAGATTIRCIEPQRGDVICTGTYRGNCVEFVAIWDGKKFQVRVVNQIKRPCAPLPKQKGTAA